MKKETGKKDTGLRLSLVKGPLTTLNNNLSGEHGDYWLTALKKMLRQEEIPQPPPEVKKLLDGLNSRVRITEKIEKLKNYLNSIPVVSEVTICSSDEDGDLFNITVYTNLNEFIQKDKHFDKALFTLHMDNTVDGVGISSEIKDKTFKEWENSYQENFSKGMNLDSFSKALWKLVEMYEKSVPEIEM